MKASIFAYEIRVGDIWNGKLVVRVDPPPSNPLEWNYQIWFKDGGITCPPAMTEMLIEREMDMI